MNEKIEQYIKKHKLCKELLFKDWDEFLTVLYENGGRVKSVLFWVYCKITEQKNTIGGGGYMDQNNPEYMWAETMICDNVSDKTVDEIREYIKSIIEEYKYDPRAQKLVPSFFLVEEQSSTNQSGQADV